jgi:hypothetical protein
LRQISKLAGKFPITPLGESSAAKAHHALGCRLLPGQDFHQSGFAGSIMADEADHPSHWQRHGQGLEQLARGNGEGHLIKLE